MIKSSLLLIHDIFSSYSESSSKWLTQTLLRSIKQQIPVTIKHLFQNEICYIKMSFGKKVANQNFDER